MPFQDQELGRLHEEIRTIRDTIEQWRGGLRVIGTVFGVLQVVVFAAITYFAAQLNADRQQLIATSRDLALAQRDISNFMGAGPRFTPEMHDAKDAQLKEWMRANFASLDQVLRKEAEHQDLRTRMNQVESRLQVLENGRK